ncbi:response regulators consisting of a CheY-like receiver domain and a winged-helix DNA-binding domain [Longilinea arvoryzae]|uniref:Response regulators consisting of a CheY-like receiver domain and a winged-helix DNA-binding domain n=1 Tax=Longilinea arvoryzae TaxID=360412 RepID=A0A0S7BKV6_9CHLR|nr:response regulator transcription factor [Longilinea arvoryzae]GAP14619.1 response regulators consisting of a CheY-like receiver domain and a winged-helix DNA-binding domain [Longilinea arvoryzae]
MGKHILIVDDDALMRRSLAFNLEHAGFRSSTAANAEDALAVARQSRPDLVLLDIGLPGMDGLDALKQFKASFRVPVIFVTARHRNLDEVVGLELGADDYITKPFDVDVLVAHIKAVLRRSTGAEPVQAPEPIQAGEISLNPTRHEVSVHEKTIELSPREFSLLQVLVQEPDRVFSVDELLARTWGAEFIGQSQVVYVHIRWLREKIEADPSRPTHILTVRGVGYKLAGGK